METNESKNKKSELLPHIIIIATFALLLWQTWRKWGNPVIDTGRELWLPAELLKGRILYKDIVSFYGFLPSYLIASLYGIFGVGINTLMYTGIALTITTSFTIYRICRLFLDQDFSTLVVITFLFVFAFGQYATSGIFNFILPYTFAATFFMTFTALALYFFLKFIFSGNNKNLITWSLFLTASFLCRPESSTAVWPAFLLSGIILAGKQPHNERFKLIAYILSPLLFAVLFYGLFFLITHTFHDFMKTFLGSIKVVADTPVSKEWSGIDDISTNLSKISTSFLLHIAVVLGLAMSYRLVKPPDDTSDEPAPVVIPILTAFLFFMLLKQSCTFELQYRCITLVLFCGTLAYFLQALKRSATNRTLALLALFTASFLLTYRIFLAASPYQYGFSLLALPLICYYIFFGDLVKTAVENRFKMPEGVLATAMAGFFVLMILHFWKISNNGYQRHNKLASTSKGSLYYDDTTQAKIFWESVDYVKENIPHKSTLTVFPEGVGINFFTDHPNVLRHHSFMPHDIKLFGEDNILKEIQAANIDYIVILSRDTKEFGPASFGVDYAQKIQKWIDKNYSPIKQFGAKPFTSKKVGALILKKKIAGF